MHKPIISIIIVNFNGLDFLKICLPTIRKQTYKNFEIILVDNHSKDKTVEFVLKHYPQIKIIKNKINCGFAEANNQGAKIAKGEYLFLVNNDTELFSDTIEKLVKTHKDGTILAAFQIPSRNKKSQGRAGGGIDIFGYPYVNHANLSKTKFFYADGAALFISRKNFFDLGMFDEELFMFQEDIDFSWRAQIMGYKIEPCWNAKLYHYYGGTAKINVNKSNQYISSYFRRYLNERNVIRNIIKNYSFPLVIIVLFLLTFFHIFEAIFFLIMGKLKVVKCYLKAYLWNIKNIKSSLKVRNEVQKQRKISDWVLMKKMYWSYSKVDVLMKIGIPHFE